MPTRLTSASIPWPELAVKGQEYIDEGYCFIVRKKQPDGDYRIHVDVYSPIKFEVL